MLDPTNLQEVVKYSKTLNVLYVEDNQETRNATLMMLENFFDFVTVGINGKDGLDKFSNTKYDLILSDINMPVMNGIDMVKNIRLEDEDVSIIMISAHNEKDFRDNASKYNLDEYMIKPTNFNNFIKVISQTVEKIYNKKI